MSTGPGIGGPIVKAVETLRTFVRGPPSSRTLWANRRQRFGRAHAILPSDAVVGEPIECTIQAWDQCERLIPGFQGAFELDATDPDAEYPSRVRFPPENDGLASVPGVTFRSPGIQYLTLTHTASGERFVANPVRVHETAPEERLFWGDIHLHSQHSDGAGAMADGLRFGRDVMRLDVVAYTDHDTMGFFIPPSWQRRRMHERYFDRMKEVTAEFHDPGEFVTLFAYEWTKQPNMGGHINVYFDSVESAELFDSLSPGTNTYEDLWARLRAWNEEGPGEALTVPHHPAEGMYPFDFDAVEYDDELAPLVEVYSVWGSSERPASAGNPRPLAMGQGEVGEPGYYVQDALRMGYRVGLTASADHHGPQAGHSLIHTSPHLPSLGEWRRHGVGWSLIWRIWNERSYPGGLQAFYAPELTREAVFESLRSRRVYGTTQPDRIVIEFSIDGVAFGEHDSTLRLDAPDAPRDVRATVAGTAPIAEAVVIKNNRPWRTATGTDDPDAPLDAYSVEAEWTDAAPVTGMRWDEERGSDADVYYLRVTQADGGMAWAGPVWVEPPGTAD